MDSSKSDQNNESLSNVIAGQKRRREDYISEGNSAFNHKRKRGSYSTVEKSGISSQKEKIDIEQEENISTFKKGRFDNNLSLKTRKEASKVLKKLLEGLDQEYRSDVKDVYYIIENRDKVGIPLISLKVKCVYIFFR